MDEPMSIKHLWWIPHYVVLIMHIGLDSEFKFYGIRGKRKRKPFIYSIIIIKKIGSSSNPNAHGVQVK